MGCPHRVLCPKRSRPAPQPEPIASCGDLPSSPLGPLRDPDVRCPPAAIAVRAEQDLAGRVESPQRAEVGPVFGPGQRPTGPRFDVHVENVVALRVDNPPVPRVVVVECAAVEVLPEPEIL